MTQKLKFEQLSRFGFGPEIMRKTKLCPQCRCLVTDGKKICPNCAERLPDLTLFAWYEQQHEICTHCRTLLSPDAQYCPHCGRRVLQRAGGAQP